MADLTYIQLYHSYLDAIEPLGDAERGRLFTALLEYGKLGAVPELSGNERFIFPMMRAQMDRDRKAYEEKCTKNAQNRKGASTTDSDRSRSSTNATKEKEKKKEKKKEKEISPDGDNTPLVPPLDDFSPLMKKAIGDWMAYKLERKDKYTPTGLEKWLTIVKKHISRYGEAKVIAVIDLTISSGWKGVVWDKLDEEKQQKPPPAGASRKSFSEAIAEEDGLL